MKTIMELANEIFEQTAELKKMLGGEDLIYAQVFWKQGMNTTGYYTEEQLKDKSILHYTIIER